MIPWINETLQILWRSYWPIVILASGVVKAGLAGLLLFVLVRLNYIETGFAAKTIRDWLKVVAVPIAGVIITVLVLPRDPPQADQYRSW